MARRAHAARPGGRVRAPRAAPAGGAERILATALLAVGLLVALALLGDVATTACGISSGATREANPFTIWWMGRFGLRGWIVFRLCLGLMVGTGSVIGAQSARKLAARRLWLAALIPPLGAVTCIGALSAVTVIGNVQQGSMSCLAFLAGR